MRFPRSKAVAALLLLATMVAAIPAGADTASSGSSFQTLLLPLTVAGASDGKATFKAGIGAAFGIGERHDLAVSLSTSAATEDGLANIFAFKAGDDQANAPSTWDLGLNVSYSLLGEKRKTGPTAGLPDAVLKQMFEACDQRCDKDSKDDFCTKRPDRLLENLNPWIDATIESNELKATDFCLAQLAAVQEADKKEGLTPDAHKQARKAALIECVKTCAKDGSDAFCSLGPVRAERSNLYQNYGFNDSCDEGKAIHRKYEDDNGRRLFPRWIINAGAKAGWQQHKYRYASADDANLLLAKTETVNPWSAGFSVLYLPQDATVNPTFELQGLVGGKYDAQKTVVKWCSPAGQVPRKDPLPGEPTGPTDPGQSCQEATLGAPTSSTTITLVFRAGIADGSRANWRMAFGPDFDFTSTDGVMKFTGFALRAPIYGAIQPISDKDYKGLLRLTPALTATRTETGPMDFRVVLDLAVLGQRRIFSDRFDQL